MPNATYRQAIQISNIANDAIGSKLRSLDVGILRNLFGLIVVDVNQDFQINSESSVFVGFGPLPKRWQFVVGQWWCTAFLIIIIIANMHDYLWGPFQSLNAFASPALVNATNRDGL